MPTHQTLLQTDSGFRGELQFTCAAPKDPKYRTEVQRFFRAKAIAFVNGGTKVDDRHLLLLFDDDVLAGAVVHSFVPTLDALGGVCARVVDYIGVALDYQGKTGKILTNLDPRDFLLR